MSSCLPSSKRCKKVTIDWWHCARREPKSFWRPIARRPKPASKVDSAVLWASPYQMMNAEWLLASDKLIEKLKADLGRIAAELDNVRSEAKASATSSLTTLAFMTKLSGLEATPKTDSDGNIVWHCIHASQCGKGMYRRLPCMACRLTCECFRVLRTTRVSAV